MRTVRVAAAGCTMLCALAVPSGLGPPGAVAAPPAQSAPTVYSLVDRWINDAADAEIAPLEWPAGHAPGGLGFDRGDGTLYAVDRTAATVRVYRPDGAFSHAIGGPGGAPGQLHEPFDVDGLPDGMLAVSDAGNQRVQILRSDGAPVRQWPVSEPRGITVVRRGTTLGAVSIFVVSHSLRTLVEYNFAGNQIDAVDIAMRGTASQPLDVAFAGDVRVSGQRPPIARTFFLTDPAIGSVYRLMATESPTLAGLHSLADVSAVGTWRADWLTLSTGNRGVETHVAGGPGYGVMLLSPPSAGAGPDGMPFDAVAGVDVAPDGRVYATVKPGGLVALGAAATFAERAGRTYGFLHQPQRIAVGDAALVLDRRPEVRLWTPAGARIGRVPVPLDCLGRSGGSSACRPVDVAASGGGHFALTPDGIARRIDVAAVDFTRDVWDARAGLRAQRIALDAAADRVAVLDLLGQEVSLLTWDWLELARWPISADFKGAMDVAVSDTHVFLANQQASTLEIWTHSGSFVASTRVVGGPVRVADGPDGTAFVLTGADWVFMFGPDGEPRGAWPAGAPKERPADLAVGADGRVYVADPGGEVRVYAPDPAAPSRLPPPAGDTACAILRDKGAAPPEIWLGETVEVQLRVDGECPIERKTADVVLTIDHSGSMLGDKVVAAKHAATTFVALTDPLLTRLGIVAFDDEAETLSGLTNDRRGLVEALHGLTAAGGTDIVDAVRASADLLEADARPGAGRVIVFMSDGRHSTNRPGAGGLAELPGIIQGLRDAGIQVYAIGLGADADEATLKALASSEAHYFFSPTAAELRGIYVQVARRIEAANLFASATLVDRVPANMTYIPGSGEPAEPEVSPDGRTLTWRMADVLEPGFLLTYRVRPEAVGRWPTNVEAWLDYVDGLGHPGRTVFPIPFVRVLGPTPTPSATPTDTPTPTPSASPTASPSATPTPTPSATPTPPPEPIFLPLLVRERCDATRLHVVLVLDTSTSMAEPFRPGDRPKVDALRDAVRAFVAASDLARDVVTLIRFSGDASVVASGADRAALEHAVAALTLSPGTRIDLGLDAARTHIAASGTRADTRPVVVLLSDGAPTPGTRAAALDSAAALRGAGVTLYTIAVGADADRALLAEIAGAPARALVADGAAALVELYDRMAGQLAPCVPSWGGG